MTRMNRENSNNSYQETTFDRFITDDPIQKEKFDKEYEEFLLSEFVLEKMQEENLTVRGLAQKANVSPTVIQKIRKPDSMDHIAFRTFLDVIDTLGYKMNLVRK